VPCADRDQVPDDSSERAALAAHLAGARRHVLAQLDGLSDEQLRRPVLPSGWSCLGLVRHLTLSDERYWFGVVVAGEPLDFWPEGENGDWVVAPDEPADGVLAAYRSAIERSDEIVSARSLDQPPAHPEDWWAEAGVRFPDVRAVAMHVVVETATHAGQLDAVRELLDGRQYVVL
jgi:uncharacterized damage-inducible protein DinB